MKITIKHKYFSLLILAFFTFSLFQVSSVNAVIGVGSVEGTITDSSSGVPISGASITLRPSGIMDSTTSTDSNGYYKVYANDLLMAPLGATLIVSKSGYDTKTVGLTLIPGSTVTKNIALISNVPVIPTVPVILSDNFDTYPYDLSKWDKVYPTGTDDFIWDNYYDAVATPIFQSGIDDASYTYMRQRLTGSIPYFDVKVDIYKQSGSYATELFLKVIATDGSLIGIVGVYDPWAGTYYKEYAYAYDGIGGSDGWQSGYLSATFSKTVQISRSSDNIVHVKIGGTERATFLNTKEFKEVQLYMRAAWAKTYDQELIGVGYKYDFDNFVYTPISGEPLALSLSVPNSQGVTNENFASTLTVTNDPYYSTSSRNIYIKPTGGGWSSIGTWGSSSSGTFNVPLSITSKGSYELKAQAYSPQSGTVTSNIIPITILSGPLYAYYTLDNMADDSSENNLHGSERSATSYVAGKRGFSGSFTGSTTSAIDLGNSNFKITGSQTIAMWLYPTDFTARRNPYAKAYGGEGTITQEISGTLSYYYGTAGGNAQPYQGFSSGQSLALNKWTHVALTRDLSNMVLKWYFNGEEISSTTASYSAAKASTLNAYIGAGYVSAYKGMIDELKLYSKALPAHEIQDLASEPNLIGSWRLDEESGDALDSSGSEYHGNLINTPVQGENGKVSNAYSFGGNQYIDIGDFSGEKLSDPTGQSMSWGAWIKPAESGFYRYIISTGGQTSSRGFGLMISASDTIWCGFHEATSGAGKYSTVTVPNNIWSHVMCTYDQSQKTLFYYKNGQLVDSSSATANTYVDTKTLLTIGYPNSLGGHGFRGLLDEVQIYDYALSESQISGIANRPENYLELGFVDEFDGSDGWTTATGDHEGLSNTKEWFYYKNNRFPQASSTTYFTEYDNRYLYGSRDLDERGSQTSTWQDATMKRFVNPKVLGQIDVDFWWYFEEMGQLEITGLDINNQVSWTANIYDVWSTHDPAINIAFYNSDGGIINQYYTGRDSIFKSGTGHWKISFEGEKVTISLRGTDYQSNLDAELSATNVRPTHQVALIFHTNEYYYKAPTYGVFDHYREYSYEYPYVLGTPTDDFRTSNFLPNYNLESSPDNWDSTGSITHIYSPTLSITNHHIAIYQSSVSETTSSVSLENAYQLENRQIFFSILAFNRHITNHLEARAIIEVTYVSGEIYSHSSQFIDLTGVYQEYTPLSVFVPNIGDAVIGIKAMVKTYSSTNVHNIALDYAKLYITSSQQHTELLHHEEDTNDRYSPVSLSSSVTIKEITSIASDDHNRIAEFAITANTQHQGYYRYQYRASAIEKVEFRIEVLGSTGNDLDTYHFYSSKTASDGEAFGSPLLVDEVGILDIGTSALASIGKTFLGLFTPLGSTMTIFSGVSGVYDAFQMTSPSMPTSNLDGTCNSAGVCDDAKAEFKITSNLGLDGGRRNQDSYFTSNLQVKYSDTGDNLLQIRISVKATFDIQAYSFGWHHGDHWLFNIPKQEITQFYTINLR